MQLQQRIQDFVLLGETIQHFFKQPSLVAGHRKSILEKAIGEAAERNPWFVEPFINEALQAIASWLDESKLLDWAEKYPRINEAKSIGVVMAGNVPAVGFHDFLCVLLSGHRLLMKPSRDDLPLMQAMALLLMDINPDWEKFIKIESHLLKNFDAIIATGSNNTSRYFDAYFGKYPNIIRRSRTSVAILPPNPDINHLHALAYDAMQYFGLGCRSVSKVYLPASFVPENLFDGFNEFDWMRDHARYFNNYEYQKAILLVNGTPHLDNGFLLLKEDPNLVSPIGVLHYAFYENPQTLLDELHGQREYIQCIACAHGLGVQSVLMGKTQQPSLCDYADGIDTMHFLCRL